MAPNHVPIYRIERGGEVTYHGPGQLVVYPLIYLKRKPYQEDLHWYLRQMEEVVIQTLQYYDLEGVRDEINTGRMCVFICNLHFQRTNIYRFMFHVCEGIQPRYFDLFSDSNNTCM